MSTQTGRLAEWFDAFLIDFYQTEKQLIKQVTRLSEAGLTAELRKALSPTETEGAVHVERLQQILKLRKLKTDNTTNGLATAFLAIAKAAIGRKGKPSIAKDLAILNVGKQMMHYRIACYQSLHIAAETLGLDLPTMLLEQCLREDQNTDAYLNQVAQNVLYIQFEDAKQEPEN